MKMKLILCLLIAIVVTFSLDAQKLNSRQGQVLIELGRNENPDKVVRSLNNKLGSITKIVYQQVISAPMNVWKLSFDFDVVSEKEILQLVRTDRAVYNSQLNHLTNLRTVPNDPEFVDQWQYINIGQDNGVENEDIDIDAAWDITTGGLTTSGDTIVVCVIDDGLDASHEDFGANIWKNHAEIPGNDIDDDGNGYVDDYNGWDTYTNTDNVFTGGGHGTPVAGIIGAKGNNGIGVSGTNWDVKLMIVNGGGDEADALAAYAYPYHMRKIYNESNGSEGAFVVSTNASWGVDFGQPEDAPLWCNFYDSLGMIGIINCGATINDNINVDIVGDLPSGCASDFLISVSNVDRNGDKVEFAGYGLNTIDLGAYGEETHTVSFGNRYGAFGGTSAATPHVAGAAALIYSLPYPGLMALAKSNPAEAALLVKTAILEGVRKDARFQDLFATSGVLNLRNSVGVMQSVFSSCPFPLEVAVDLIDLDSLTVSWEDKEEALTYDLRYKLVAMDSTEWVEELGVTAPFAISDLEICGTYEVQLRSNCVMDSSSDYSFSKQFTTLGCCLAVGDIGVTSAEDIVPANSLFLSWPNDPDHVSYTVEYKLDEEVEWQSLPSDTNSVTISDLGFCTLYDLRVKALCITGIETEYSDIVQAPTACGNCTNLDYCPPPSVVNSGEWIESVTIDSIVMETGPNGGYKNNSGFFDVDLRIGTEVQFKLDKGFDSDFFDEWVKVWLDSNLDGVFSDDEVIFDEGQATEFDIDTFIEINDVLGRGITLMRVGMVYDAEPVSCDTLGAAPQDGEYEDFCVRLVGPCDYGLSIESVFPQADQATVTFTMVDTSIAYNVRYKKVIESDEEWTTISVLDTVAQMTDLEECTDYDVEVRAVCDTDTSGFMAVSEVFTTSGEGCMVSTFDTDLYSISVKAYPNPFVEKIHFKITSNVSDELLLNVVNIHGQLLYSNNTRINSGDNTIEIPNTDDWAPGIYFVRLKGQGIEKSTKVIKLAN